MPYTVGIYCPLPVSGLLREEPRNTGMLQFHSERGSVMAEQRRALATAQPDNVTIGTLAYSTRILARRAAPYTLHIKQ